MEDRLLHAYLAGLFDGEGCVYTRPDKRVFLLLEMTDRDAVELFRECFGGSVYERGDRPRARLPIYRWTGTGGVAMIAANAMLPYLRVKKDKMQIARRRNFGNKRPLAGVR